jgi:hypothetical protein
MIFVLIKQDGKIGKGLVDYISQLPDGKYQVSIEKYNHKRTSNQNRLYWSYLKLISDYNGDEVNDLHEYFKRKHLPPRFTTVMGNEIKLPNSTTKLSKSEFSEYIRAIEIETRLSIPQEIQI